MSPILRTNFDFSGYCKEKAAAFMGRQMYSYYLEWLFVYNQNKYGYM